MDHQVQKSGSQPSKGNENKQKSSKGVSHCWDKKGVAIRSWVRNWQLFLIIEQKTSKEAEKDEYWTGAMQEELNQLERNEAKVLVRRSKKHFVVGPKFGFQKQIR